MFDYKFDVQIKDKEISCKAFSLEKYIDVLKQSTEGKTSEVFKSLLEEHTNAKGLTRQESELLLIKLWAYSLGKVNHEVDYVCECGKTFPVEMNFNHANIQGERELVYPLENFRLVLKYPEIFEDSNVASMVASSIVYIEVENERIKIDELNTHEMDDLYSAITSEDIIKIGELLKEPKVVLAVPVSCSCGKSDIKTITGLKEFFRII